MTKCNVSFCDKILSRANGDRCGYCNFHYKKSLNGLNPESFICGYFNRKHNFDEDYFKIIDSADKAYILGMFAADGCIESKYVVSWGQNDKSLLEYIRRQLAADDYDIEKNKNGCYILQLASKKLVADIESLGFRRRKSYVDCQFPKIKKLLYAPFVLGLFDGDGSIYANTPKRHISKMWMVEFMGTPSILYGVRSILHKEAGTSSELSIKKAATKGDGLCCRMRLHGNRQTERVGKWLYSNMPSFCLTRKREKFEELFESRKIAA